MVVHTWRTSRDDIPARTGRRTPRLPLVVLTCVALAASGCSLLDSDDPASPRPQGTGSGVGWRDCSDIPTKLVGRTAKGVTYECTTIDVPRDWTPPAGTQAESGTKLQVSLLRARAADQSNRIGSLVVNPGGPGASGVDTAVYLSLGPSYGGLPKEITQRFDIVGFDPRGVGRSSAVDCVQDADFDAMFGADPDPVDRRDFDELLAVSDRIADSCEKKYGAGLAAYSTEQTARDMDAVRIAVGDEKLTYLGYSYGTLLGATYAQLFPQRVRAFVLDGAIDPRADLVSASESQAKGFEKAFGNFAAWCRSALRECPIAPDARGALTTALDKSRVSPARDEDGREATAGWIFWAVVSSLYNKSGWAELAKALDTLAAGDPKAVFELADRYVERDAAGRYGTMFDAFYAVNCADEAAEVSPAAARKLQEQWRAKYPLFGPALATGLLTCASWPVKGDPYPTGEAKGAAPIVVIGTTGDPATPYEQTAKLAEMLGVGRVLTNEGEGHTAYPEADCVTKAVDSYLLELKVPAHGLRCPAR